MNTTLIDEILAIEYDMFDAVINEGGPADCHGNEEGFRIMRGSQFEAWDTPTLFSYLGDLQAALHDGRNLMTEKYVHMMAFTNPEEYASLKACIPLPSRKAVLLAQEISEVLMCQTQKYAQKYPCLAKQGRNLTRAGDTTENTSVETYQLGELYTYSADTLLFLRAHLRRLTEENKSLPMLIMENTVRKYGYSSLDQAEEVYRKKAGFVR